MWEDALKRGFSKSVAVVTRQENIPFAVMWLTGSAGQLSEFHFVFAKKKKKRHAMRAPQGMLVHIQILLGSYLPFKFYHFVGKQQVVGHAESDRQQGLLSVRLKLAAGDSIHLWEAHELVGIYLHLSEHFPRPRRILLSSGASFQSIFSCCPGPIRRCDCVHIQIPRHMITDPRHWNQLASYL